MGKVLNNIKLAVRMRKFAIIIIISDKNGGLNVYIMTLCDDQ